jgi:glycerol-3-phosphate acyltransferase PlsY
MFSTTSLLTGGVIGYFIGSIPFAYIVTRMRTGLDLRQHGSRNIGATNAFEVTGNKSIGRIVLALDLLKGLIPVLAFELFGLSPAIPVLIPALVLGHCYPLWLKFHGGRGLATIAGAVAMVNPAGVLLWCLTYLAVKKLQNSIHVAATAASLLVLVVALTATASMIQWTTLAASGLSGAPQEVSISIMIALLIVISRHIEPLLALRAARNSAP